MRKRVLASLTLAVCAYAMGDEVPVTRTPSATEKLELEAAYGFKERPVISTPNRTTKEQSQALIEFCLARLPLVEILSAHYHQPAEAPQDVKELIVKLSVNHAFGILVDEATLGIALATESQRLMSPSLGDAMGDVTGTGRTRRDFWMPVSVFAGLTNDRKVLTVTYRENGQVRQREAVEGEHFWLSWKVR